MKLHENKKLFQDAVLATSQMMEIPEIYVEKDYWVTFALYRIFHSEMAKEIVFKGGTALSKCYQLIERFSEDIDVVVLRQEGENDNQMKKKIRAAGKIVEAVMPEIAISGLTNKMGNIRKTVHQYEKLFHGNFGQVREHIVFEATWLGSFEPFTRRFINSYIADMMKRNQLNDLIYEYGLEAFELQVLSKERTVCEKIMSLARFSFMENPYENLANKIRHIYDIHMMLKNKEINSFFKSEQFDIMMKKVGNDDVISYKNNNEWLKTHPSEAIIFKNPEKAWENIKSVYRTKFRELVIGELPREVELIESLKTVFSRLQQVKWDPQFPLV
ncbi:nucleotidyl transferase AbiEii/AbiGii toxin family protein [Thermophagus sp. OGC60D27]|uniref:nucleotidyl transferase AbiEii/AbiGii toxin family protein n=1 Tax=Thermophagus sp. OGC60D27 TaxID=3458415 RepID=UPI0040381119